MRETSCVSLLRFPRLPEKEIGRGGSNRGLKRLEHRTVGSKSDRLSLGY